jgi:hypothetical protein
MNDQSHQAAQGNDSRITKGKRVVAFMVVVFMVCILAFVALEFLPRFVFLSIELPKDDVGPGYWTSTTYSVSNVPFGRVFQLRKHSFLGYLSAENVEQKYKIRDNFDDQLTGSGWIASEDYDICADYLPEAKLLIDESKGFLLQYQEPSKPVYYDGSYFGKLICIAVLESSTSEEKADQVYQVILLTAQQSTLKIFTDYFGAL